jgi:spore coat protein JC
MPLPELKATLTDIGTEELNHLEMIGAIVYQLTKDLTEDEIKKQGFEDYFVDHTTGVYPQSAGGSPYTTASMQVKGDPITDLHENMAAEQKARSTYDNILRFCDDYDVKDAIRFLREREVVHYQRFGEAKREDCSKKSTVLKAHKYSTFGKILSIRKTQDVGISRPICC